MKSYIAKQLRDIKSKYAKPRQTQLLYEDELDETIEEERPDDNTVNHIMFTKEGYFKKISLRSLKASESQKLKDGDSVILEEDAVNSDELIFFSDAFQVYKAHVGDFDTLKSGELGDYIPAKLGFDEEEHAIGMCRLQKDNECHRIILVFENGTCVRIPANSYDTKSNRRKLTGAYSDHASLVAVFYETAPLDILMISKSGKALLTSSENITEKASRKSRGASVMTLKKGDFVTEATIDPERVENSKKYRKNKLPSSGTVIKE